MHVAFRADAGPETGIGHLMRCLSLADELRALGCRTTFLSRRLSAELSRRVRSRGHELQSLDSAPQSYGAHDGPPPHSAWLGTNWMLDARETAAFLKEKNVSVLVTDHYALDANWEEAVVSRDVRLVAIDDIADRPHNVAMLIDHNIGRDPEHYRDLVPEGCIQLVGSRYALLRREFTDRRDEAFELRKDNSRERVLINLGGGEHGDLIIDLLKGLNELPQADTLSVSAFAGSFRPGPKTQSDGKLAFRFGFKQLPFSDDMAEITLGTDFCIGAAGGSALERCALLQPSVVLPLAENQVRIARELENRGCALVIKRRDELSSQFRAAMASLRCADHYGQMVEALASIAVGDARVAARRIYEDLL